jgi:hypothetical protein
MYARLVTPAGGAIPLQCMRDIGRLITSANPSLSDLSGSGYSATTSLVVDNTPAGWTYVGSTNTADQSGIGAGGASATMMGANLCFKAPMNEYTELYKFAVLTHANTLYNNVSYGQVFALTGATNATTAGVVTNEGYRQTASTTSATIVLSSMSTAALVTHHVIANANHITIIQENTGMMAVWETTMTELHKLYGLAALVQYTHPNATSSGIANNVTAGTAPATTNIAGVSFNVQVPGGAFSGTYRCSDSGNVGFLFQTTTGNRANTVNTSGQPRYQVSPVFVHNHLAGQAVQYVTGVVPIYWTKGGLGSSGDNVIINGDVYTYFNCGASALFGVLLQTS